MMHALVTGGAGFIGSHLCEALLKIGYHVTCIDNLSTGSFDNIRHLPAIRFIEGDINQPQTLAALAGEKFMVLFHYAAAVGVRRTEENPGLVLADRQGIRHVAQFVRAGGAQKVIYASSSEVYGQPRHLPEAETDPVTPWSPYTAVKLYGEQVVAGLWHADRLPAVSLRFFNVYGPRQRGNHYGFVTSQFIEQALRNQPLTIFGDGQQTRDFVYINDNIQAALAALRLPAANGHCINVGTGYETPILDLAATINRLVGREQDLAPIFAPARPLEIRRRRASVAKMHTLLNITCATPLATGLRHVLAALKQTTPTLSSPVP